MFLVKVREACHLLTTPPEYLMPRPNRGPYLELYAAMRIIINEIWTLEQFMVEKLAKYMRCLFQATLPLDDDLGLGLMDEFCEWTCEASKVRTSEYLRVITPIEIPH